MLALAAGLTGIVLIGSTLLEAFESMVLPRRVTRGFRVTRVFYRSSWYVWRRLALLVPGRQIRGDVYSLFGPLSLLTLFSFWALTLIAGFALLQAAVGSSLQAPEQGTDLFTYVYFSGVTFFTLGYGDVVPLGAVGRALAVAEAGLGFGFLAVVVGYLPSLTQAFSAREVTISMLDARAGSPPTAAQFLLRLGQTHDTASVDPFLAEWERWAAVVLESHLSYPVLSFYRSQHDNQSWLAALTAVLDICALLLATIQVRNPHQAGLTFAMCRHTAVDLALVFRTPPRPPEPSRLRGEDLSKLLADLTHAGAEVRTGPEAEKRLEELRLLYEPFVQALADYFHLPLPAIMAPTTGVDNWQTSAWTRRSPGIGALSGLQKQDGDDHFI